MDKLLHKTHFNIIDGGIFEALPLTITLLIYWMTTSEVAGFGISLIAAAAIRIILYFFENELHCIGGNLRKKWDKWRQKYTTRR